MGVLRTTIFTACEKGHDLTGRDSYIYLRNGERACRACTVATKTKKSAIGTTWHDKFTNNA